MTDLASENADRRTPDNIVPPPTTIGAILRQVGPGLIIAANIVGSGELIMTTKTGAEAGITLLWLILLGCVVKVFVQLELGRFTISHGETTLTSLNRVPGPRAGRINWVVLLWGFMTLTTVGQLGGIVGGVGQALALTVPITGDTVDAVKIPSEKNVRAFADWQLIQEGSPPVNDAKAGEKLAKASEAERARIGKHMAWIDTKLQELGPPGENLLSLARKNESFDTESGENLTEPKTIDDKIWVIIVGVFTATVLFIGRYKLIERFSVTLVVTFSFITLCNVIALQQSDRYGLSADEIIAGLTFRLPDVSGALVTAFATFGIIGVGASELISYPYWCLEKGYAKSVGPRDSSEAWLNRARGWFRVMKFDAFASMVIYTIATAAFFFMGAAVLYSEGRNPEGMRMVSTLAQSYVPVFGDYARWLFLGGAIAVLYSTYLVANAGNARMVSDFLSVSGLKSTAPDSDQRAKMVTIWSVLLPLACVLAYVAFPKPVHLVTIAGMAQAIMLPIIGFSSIYFRYRETDERLRPGKVWDALLIVSCIALLIAGGWGIFKTAGKLFG